MTEQEVRRVKAHLYATFPSLKDWAGGLDGLDESGRQVACRDKRDAMGKRWTMTLLDVEVDDALRAVDEIARSENDPWPYSSDKERAAAIVASKARSFASARSEARRSASVSIGRRSVANAGLGIMARLEAAVAASGQHDEACQRHRQAKGRCRPGCGVTEAIAREIAAEDVGLEDDRAIYDCPHCRDSGQVEVMYPADVLAVASGADPAQFTRATTARCSCRLGQMRERGMQPGEKWGRFDPELHVNARRSRQQVRLDCSAIADAYRRMTDKRVAMFDAFNEDAA